MLEAVLRHIRNWFVGEVVRGDLSIKNGRIQEVSVPRGQYIRVVGSVFNDGLHEDNSGMTDEEFSGEVHLLRIPEAVIELSERIAEWDAKYGSASRGPYSSESFGGYSYTIGTQNGQQDASKGWQAAFADELRQWRRV